MNWRSKQRLCAVPNALITAAFITHRNKHFHFENRLISKLAVLDIGPSSSRAYEKSQLKTKKYWIGC